jgi:hypothetical protein
MFDRITNRYAALVCAAYGMTLSDIGIQSTSSGGETLAGAIRSERKTRKTGYARLKKKLKYYFDQILPPTLEFTYVDYDDEVNVALGRSRLANATAMKMLIESGQFTPEETRKQLIVDGMFTIGIPEGLPPEARAGKVADNNQDIGDTLGNPVPATQGGDGEIVRSQLELLAYETIDLVMPVIRQVINAVGEDDPSTLKYTMRSAVAGGTVELDAAVAEMSQVSDNPKVDIVLKKAAILYLAEFVASGIADYNELVDTVSSALVENYSDIVKF